LEHFDWIKGFVLPYINFAIFLFVAIKFFRKPLNAMAALRRENYEKSFQQAKKAKEEADVQHRALSERLAGLDREIKSQLDTVKKAAELEAKQIVESAKQLAEHIRSEAKRVAQAELEQAKESLRREIVSAVTSTVTEKLKRELGKSQQTDLVRAKLGSLQAVPGEA